MLGFKFKLILFERLKKSMSVAEQSAIDIQQKCSAGIQYVSCLVSKQFISKFENLKTYKKKTHRVNQFELCLSSVFVDKKNKRIDT